MVIFFIGTIELESTNDRDRQWQIPYLYVCGW